MFRNACALALGLGVAVSAEAAETERTIRAELSGTDLANFAIENLAGRMRVSVGSSDRLTVVATVRAETAELAQAMRLERVGNGGATATLRVRYPSDVSTVRYADPGRERDWPFGDVGASETYDYDGRRMRVNPGRGSRLSVDLEIQVPSGARHASFRNLVGRIEAEGLQGTLRFEVGSADLRLRGLDGEISVAGDSGDIQATGIRGSFDFDSSSGDCRLEDFDGQQFRFHASSGDLVARGVRAQRVEAETSSGDVSVSSADIEEFEADSSSGDIAVDVQGDRLTSFRVSTSSGDVVLGLPADGSFDAEADQSSGDMVVGFAEGSAVHDDEALVAFRRGSGGAKVRVSTSSGDFTIAPR